MKKLIVLLSMVLSVVASAAEVKVLEVANFTSSNITGSFGLNESLGRAWVEVDVDNTIGSEASYDSYRALVDGLYYNSTTQKAILTVDGVDHECAALKSTGVLVFRTKVLKATGCKFKSKVITVDFDNGFEIEKRKVLQVFLVTK